jgi:uncharacterized protein with HEPN domain
MSWPTLYFGVNLRMVWQTIYEDLPPLKTQLNEVLRQGGDK